ncbi:mRNA splicing protein yju2 [Colletotrichum asianum]|uniref:Splicing factor YJU2 n=1 Tax=Colletotrichum asianum TaxID=702518 RepID=A0A8H3WDG1_9PEZI|nr:mRNA splicing protein yju2 [Colletotrichum asianum]
MSERKVLSKYYPPDFDPRQLQRTRGAKPNVQTVRLMAPFFMQCTTCGEFIYRGRKFNARKTTPNEKYLGIQIFRFFIRCTRCSSEITFRTDPKAGDHICEAGAKRNTEPWRTNIERDETIEARLDRLEQEEKGQGQHNQDSDAMRELEEKMNAAETQIAVADALDEIRFRNARRERLGRAVIEPSAITAENMEEKEDTEAAKRAFSFHAKRNVADMLDHCGSTEMSGTQSATAAFPSRRPTKRSKPLAALQKGGVAKPQLVDYNSDSD